MRNFNSYKCISVTVVRWSAGVKNNALRLLGSPVGTRRKQKREVLTRWIAQKGRNHSNKEVLIKTLAKGKGNLFQMGLGTQTKTGAEDGKNPKR